jgi:hypothetical protein
MDPSTFLGMIWGAKHRPTGGELGSIQLWPLTVINVFVTPTTKVM